MHRSQRDSAATRDHDCVPDLCRKPDGTLRIRRYRKKKGTITRTSQRWCEIAPYILQPNDFLNARSNRPLSVRWLARGYDNQWRIG
jgi:hypothetical protein